MKIPRRTVVRRVVGQWVLRGAVGAGLAGGLGGALRAEAAGSGPDRSSHWPQPYAVRRGGASGLLTLSTPYCAVSHDPKRGGCLSSVRLTHGRAADLLREPIATRVRTEGGTLLTDLRDPRAQVSHRREGLRETVTVEARLLDERGRDSGARVKTVYTYRWGCVKVHREFSAPADGLRVSEVCPFATVLSPSLSAYGYREGLTEEEGAPAFSFGSNRWGKLRADHPADAPLRLSQVPRSMLLADPGVEGLEWFVGSDLAQWDLQLTGRRGQARSVLEPSREPAGLALSVSPFNEAGAAIPLPARCEFDFYLGVPLLEGHARKPWFHASFNRNRGEWVSAETVRNWAAKGVQTVHCHNDGDYYDDGLFWRDGSYPPYPDMDRYDRTIRECQQAGIRVATYFSNKELHPGTPEYRAHGQEWGRMDRKGALRHNFFRGTNEFGAQMCLRSGWLPFLKSSIDRVLRNHPLDGVYFDWNVALYCCNGAHEGKAAGAVAAGHWDIDELLDLMEWTRQRVGPGGLVIVHNTTTPMYTLENLADYVVANEWGYGKWADRAPELQDLPLEWSLVGARPRGVISYGQLNEQSPRRLHRLFALEALLGGVTPWPASTEAFEVSSILKPLGDLEQYRFEDWRNGAVALPDGRCASAVYSRPGESFILLANLDHQPCEVRCAVRPERLPRPLRRLAVADLFRPAGPTEPERMHARELAGAGALVAIPGDSVVLLRVR